MFAKVSRYTVVDEKWKLYMYMCLFYSSFKSIYFVCY